MYPRVKQEIDSRNVNNSRHTVADDSCFVLFPITRLFSVEKKVFEIRIHFWDIDF